MDARTLALEHAASAVILRHFHDECGMRLRSHLSSNLENPKLQGRARNCKVQNNHLTLISMQGRCLPYPVELQPLARKTGTTIASAILSILEEISGAMALSNDQYLLHCLVGDSISANSMAAEYVWGSVSSGLFPVSGQRLSLA